MGGRRGAEGRRHRHDGGARPRGGSAINTTHTTHLTPHPSLPLLTTLISPSPIVYHSHQSLKNTQSITINTHTQKSYSHPLSLPLSKITKQRSSYIIYHTQRSIQHPVATSIDSTARTKNITGNHNTHKSSKTLRHAAEKNA